MTEIEVQIPIQNYLPCYRHLLDSTADINFLWGGRDSGKSHFIAQKLIEKCLSADYFRCILIKKAANTIKDSQWQTIKDIVNEWGLNELFQFIENPLQIKCANGNRFLARGCDDIANIKSVKDPSDVWFEEGNQLTLTDFITVVTTLRTNKAEIQQWFSFNPEAPGDYEDFWLYKNFFENRDSYNFTDKWVIDVKDQEPVEVTFTSTHTTYHDNKHVKPVRIAFLEQLAVLDPHYYTVFTEGQWGNIQVGDRYCYCFDRSKHIKPTTLNKAFEVYLSFDFNVNPITCGVYQWDEKTKTIKGIESIKLDKSDIYKLCDYVIAAYPGCMFIITGDATGRNTTAMVQDGINYYTIIKLKLNLSEGQIKVDTVNPDIKENRVLVNSVLHNVNVELDPHRCKHLIFDCENVSVNDMGKIEKGDRSNPKKRSDQLDNFRYFLNRFFKWVLKT